MHDPNALKDVMTLTRRSLNEELPMGALYAIVALRERLRLAEISAIEGARARGASWEDIASALGITRQALHQRMHRRQVHEVPAPAHSSL